MSYDSYDNDVEAVKNKLPFQRTKALLSIVDFVVAELNNRIDDGRLDEAVETMYDVVKEHGERDPDTLKPTNTTY